jgi:hypothetical protein
MPNPNLGARSQQFPGLPSTSSAKDASRKRPRDDFIDSRFRVSIKVLIGGIE